MTLEEFKTLPYAEQESLYFNIKKEEAQFREEFTIRCEEDVKINTNLWVMQLSMLRSLYEDEETLVSTVEYLNFKMQVLAMQKKYPLYVDRNIVAGNLNILEKIVVDKEAELKSIMPKDVKYREVSKPAKMFKKDGSISAAGEKWVSYLIGCNLPNDYDGDIKLKVSEQEANPQSSKQMKDFLFSLGWQPKIFKDGANGKVPQLRDDDKRLCPDIIRLIKDYPELEALNGLSVAQHRIGYLKSFLKHSKDDGSIMATSGGFTKTLRLKHRAPMVNLPKVKATYGEYIRSCIVAPKGYSIVGADLSSIEDRTKQIMIYPLDPDYVNTMREKGYDAHLNLGLKAGMFTQEEVDYYKFVKAGGDKEDLKNFPNILATTKSSSAEETHLQLDKRRDISKTANYALTYNCGIPKLMETSGLKRKEAANLHKGYWDLNWSVSEFAKTRTTKVVNGVNWIKNGPKVGDLEVTNSQKWVWNEFTKMWLFLKNDKDIFSAINQNNGVKVFDIWCYFMIQQGVKISAQFHDEWIAYVLDEDVDGIGEKVKIAMRKVNEYFSPPIPLECDFQVGNKYSEIH